MERGDASSVNVRKFFKLDAKDGTLSVKRSLKSLERQEVHFSVRATDRGNPPLQSEIPVTVFVTPRSQPQLRFSESEFTFTVPEDAQMGVDFGIIPLVHEYPGVEFGVEWSGKEEGDVPFSVDNSGVVIVSAALDR